MSDGHGALPRGLMSTKRSPLFEGHSGLKSVSADFDRPKDGLDEEESRIPPLCTYLGQFMVNYALGR